MAEEARLIADREEQERLGREQKEEEERLRLELKVRFSLVRFCGSKAQPIKMYLSVNRTGSAERMS